MPTTSHFVYMGWSCDHHKLVLDVLILTKDGLKLTMSKLTQDGLNLTLEVLNLTISKLTLGVLILTKSKLTQGQNDNEWVLLIQLGLGMAW